MNGRGMAAGWQGCIGTASLHGERSVIYFRMPHGKPWLPARSHPAAWAWSWQEPLGLSLTQRPRPRSSPRQGRSLPPPAAPLRHPSPPGQKPPPSGAALPSGTLIPPKLPYNPCSNELPEPGGCRAGARRRLTGPAPTPPSVQRCRPGRGARPGAAARHAGSWSRALAVAQHPLGARGGVGLS